MTTLELVTGEIQDRQGTGLFHLGLMKDQFKCSGEELEKAVKQFAEENEFAFSPFYSKGELVGYRLSATKAEQLES